MTVSNSSLFTPALLGTHSFACLLSQKLSLVVLVADATYETAQMSTREVRPAVYAELSPADYIEIVG